MLELFYTSIYFFLTCLLLAIFAGNAAAFLHWAIGNPGLNDWDVCESDRGRIFSHFGAWICKKYNENERRIEEAQNRRRIKQRDKIASFAKKNYLELGLAEAMAWERNQILKAEGWIEDTRPLNWAKPFGACYFCFATWISLFVWAWAWALGVHSGWLGFYTIISVPTGVFRARRFRF